MDYHRDYCSVKHFFVGAILVPIHYQRTFSNFKTVQLEVAEDLNDDPGRDVLEMRRNLRDLAEKDTGEVDQENLPEELIEKIISYMPYPSIFKARRLSKSWRTRLSANKCSDDKETKLIKTEFQRQVGEWSNSWGTFCPVGLRGKILFAYDEACDLWRTLPLPKVFWDSQGLQVEGTFLYGFPRSTNKLCVYNIFTRTYKQLQSGPDGRVFSKILVRNIPRETFRVILLCSGPTSIYQYSIEIYDSNLNSWSSNPVVTCGSSATKEIYDTAYLNGVFYMLVSDTLSFWQYGAVTFNAFNVEEGTLEQIKVSFPSLVYLMNNRLMACNGSLLTFDYRLRGDNGDPTLCVLKIHLKSLQVSKVATAPSTLKGLLSDGREDYYIGPTNLAMTDGDSIFVGNAYSPYRVLSYNTVKDEWNSFSLPGGRGDSSNKLYHWVCGSVYI